MAYTFRPRKTNHFTGLVAESLKVVLKTQQSVRPLRVAACRQKELLCVTAFQEMEWILIDEVDATDIDRSNITDDENESEFRAPVFDTDEVVPILPDETENSVY